VRAFAPSELDALPRGDVAYVACVAQEDARVHLLDALSRRFRRIAIARTSARFDALRIAYANPAKLGVDRFLAMIGAHDAWPALIVGVGTGLTIDLVDADGLHRGGRIAPSPTLMREMLHARAAQLAPSGGTYAEFADDTEDALVSGCDGAAIALIERSGREAARLLGTPPRLLLHGGGADVLRAHLPDAELRPALVLAGLARWARLEQSA
jgi:type III pantothenate kinase